MTAPLTTAADFIAFFEGIPEEQWRVGIGDIDGSTCALGHACRRVSDNRAWAHLINLLGCDSTGLQTVSLVNDGLDPRYQQPTPKARILAALREKLSAS